MEIEEKIGLKIKNLRNKNGLTQEELAARCELTKSFISQLERGQTAPSVSTLEDIVECLGTNLSEFFGDEKEPKIVYTKEEYFEKEDKNGYKVEWLIASAQGGNIEPILVRLQPGTELKPDKPHEGEEFGYVLEGAITLHYGEDTYKVKKGDSFHYHTNKTHSISSASNKEAVFLWVSTPPSF
ncbi:MAG: helix-turn-helix transcriptional regulator [Lachnospiraceae bacterium]|nr:helix-turn-helix transcriptional regulator [Lachnospiraceae bacterium]